MIRYFIRRSCRIPAGIAAAVTGYIVLPAMMLHAAASYSLEQILAIAAHNATELRIITAESRAQLAAADIDKSDALPTVRFDGGWSLRSVSQATEKLNDALNRRTMFSALNDLNDFSNYGTGGELYYPDRLNGQTFNWSLTVGQPLVTFGKVGSILKLARMRECTAKDIARLETDRFYLRVMQEYSAAFLAQYDVSVNKASVNRARQMLLKTTSDFEAGRAIKRDLHRIEALVRHEEAEFFAAKGLANTTTRRLAATINFDDSAVGLLLEINPHGELSAPPPESGPGNIRIFLKKNEAAMLKEEYRYIRSGIYPTISLVGNITNRFMSVLTGELPQKYLPPDATYSEIRSIRDVFDKYNPDPAAVFSPSMFEYAVGLELSWSLYDGNRSRSQGKQAKKQLERSLLELETMEKEDHIALQEAQNQIITIDSMYTAVKLQINAAHEAFEQTQQDYRDGFTDFTTLLDTDRELRDAVRRLNDLKIRRILAFAQLRITMGLPVYGDTQ